MISLNQIKPRDRVLLVVMVVAVIATVFYYSAENPDSGDEPPSAWDITADQIEGGRTEFGRLVKQIQDAPAIYTEFYQLVGADSKTADQTADKQRRPDLEFQQDIALWSKDYGFGSPDIEKKIQDIDDVLEYQLVQVTLTIRDGDLKRISDLLKHFENKGLIIQDVTLTNKIDSDRVSATVTVARLVETFMMTRKQKEMRAKADKDRS